jgi:hypothetical protein
MPQKEARRSPSAALSVPTACRGRSEVAQMEGTMIKVGLVTVLFAAALYEFFVRERLISVCSRSEMGRGAGVYQRIGLAVVVSASCWLLMNSILLRGIPASRYFQPYADWVVLALALTFGWLVWTRSKYAPAVLLSRALAGTAVVGGIAFAVTALSGPFLFPTKINQGVLVGLLLIGPAFAILGGVGSLLAWSMRAKSGHTES